MVKRLLIKIIKVYQHTKYIRFSLYSSIGIPFYACKHQPSCSQYAIKVIDKYGTIRGAWLATKRLLSCRSVYTSSRT